MHTPISIIELHGGIRKLYRFPNNYGASVVRHRYSYGFDKGLWELAVIKFGSDNDWSLCYSAPLTFGHVYILGDQTEEQITELLNQIEQLPVPTVVEIGFNQ